MLLVYQYPKRIIDRLRAHDVSRYTTRVLGQLFFGNNAGVINNLQGKTMIRKNALLSSEIEANWDKGELLRKRGHLRLGTPYYDEDVMTPIQNKYSQLIEDAHIRSEYKGDVYSRAIIKAYNKIPELENLITEEISQIIQGYYGSHFHVKNLMCWRNYHVPSSVLEEVEIFSNRWHADFRPTSWLKLFINLSDVSGEDGPFHLQPRGRTADLVRGRFKDRDDYGYPNEVIEDPDNIVRATGPIGSAVFANTAQCLHRAGIPEPGHHRDIIQLVFVPSNQPISSNWLEEVEPKPFERRDS